MYNKDGKKRGHAIALFSGGLDSALAILLVLQQNIEVTAITFMTHFGCDLGDRSSCGSNPYPAAEKYGFNVKLMHLGQKFVDIVLNPEHGRGKNMNVCVDCRILMLNEAKELMKMVNADFIITGEVMGQRPMSQVKDKMFLVQNQTNLKGKLLRPLSAKLLPPTQPEIDGLIDRELLEGIAGRGRKRQIELAKKFGLEDYPNPASGCLLTDIGYSNRLRDLIQHTDHINFDDLNLLRAGRHFRVSPDVKVVVGRDELDNNAITACKQPHHYELEAVDVSSPITLIIGNPTEQDLLLAGAITAKYTTSRKEPLVRVKIINGEKTELISVKPAEDSQIAKIIIK
jgi:tRNA-uridine 2-sulfurtransferase